MKLEDAWSLGLLGLSLIVLVGGAVLSRTLATRENSVIRLVFPISALLTLAAFAVFVFFARASVKG